MEEAYKSVVEDSVRLELDDVNSDNGYDREDR